jgi:hypothetical protein
LAPVIFTFAPRSEQRENVVIEVQKRLEGQVIDGRYPLIECLGSTPHSSVFRTECDEAPNRQAAIKFIPAPAATSGAQMTRWRLAARFSHPTLLRIFGMGRCEFEGRSTRSPTFMARASCTAIFSLPTFWPSATK